MTPEQRRRLRAMVPMDGVMVDADRAKRLFDATPSDWPDEKRIRHIKGVMRMLAEPDRVVGF